MTAIDPAALRPHYRAFVRDDRILLTGHSHQAWPDVAREGMLRAFDDAAEHVDDKWEAAFAAAERLRGGIAARLGATSDEIALGGSTHELVARFLSALDLRARPRIVTTRGEFHSAHRQLTRLSEEGLDVRMIDVAPVATLAERLAAEVDARTSAVLVSSVLFETSSIVPGIAALAERARRFGAALLVDAYHAFGVVPFTVAELGGDVFVVAGGYKYAQWGEGCCFLRVPPGCTLRPVYTGWFSDFAHLAAPRDGGRVGYGTRGADRFAGSTYDPTSHYRAVAVLDFFDREELTVPRLRALSLLQTARLIRGLEGVEIATPRGEAERGGFVAVRHPRAGELVEALRAEHVLVDARGELLRLGPAPYVTDDELDRAIAILRRLTR
ncbi:MAG: aminotransferase class V-fold PLP-dependent enzyme [Sandaracinus sp.]